MRKHDDEYKMGNVIAYNQEPKKYKLPRFTDEIGVGKGSEKGSRRGEIGHPVHEGEDAGSVEDENDQEVREKALTKFSNTIKNIVSAKLMDKEVKLSMKGQEEVVNQLGKTISKEVAYLKAIMSGQAADTPALQKNKADLDAEINQLSRMLGVDDFWPFK